MTELYLIGQYDDYEGPPYNADIDIQNGRALELTDDRAIRTQRAVVTGYMEQGAVPLMEHRGIDWTGYITREKTLNEIDGQIRQNLSIYLGDDNKFIPQYGRIGDQTTIQMNEMLMTGESV